MKKDKLKQWNIEPFTSYIKCKNCKYTKAIKKTNEGTIVCPKCFNIAEIKNDKYKVTHYTDNSWACSCSHWIFRHSKPEYWDPKYGFLVCKHIELVIIKFINQPINSELIIYIPVIKDRWLIEKTIDVTISTPVEINDTNNRWIIKCL